MALPNIEWSIAIWPIIIIGFYLIHFSALYSNVIKETINIVFVLAMAYSFHRLNQTLFLKYLVLLVTIAGLLAISRFAISLFCNSIPFSEYLFEGNGFALVNDCNFYSLLFLLAVLVADHLFKKEIITSRQLFLVDVISIINIVFCMSRRGYFLYAILLLSFVLVFVFQNRSIKQTLINNLLITSAFLICALLVLSFSNIFYSPQLHPKAKHKFYKMSTLFDNNTSLQEFDIKRQRAYYKEFPINENLFYNGDLKIGLENWGVQKSKYDCLITKLVTNENEETAIRITRGCSSGYWQIKYTGRPIVYYQGVTYNISFKYRVIEGGKRPFNVGWWVDEGEGWRVNQPLIITPIDSVWSKCEASYTFKETQLNPTCFLNSQRAGSIIEVKDICMTCNDTLGLPRYIDQLPDSLVRDYYAVNDTVNFLTHTRTDRWLFAWELWQTRYNWKQKIFGHGFDYLEWYGERFYNNPKRYDFPHNPIISSFLYSGIVGGIAYICFLIMSLWLYWSRRADLGIFFVMYLCCMFFCMFSGSSHFSFPLFAFLSFLPFVEREKTSISGTQRNNV